MQKGESSSALDVAMDKQHMKSFCDNYILSNQIKQPMCHKYPDKTSQTNFVLTNAADSFQNTYVITDGYDHFFSKLKPSVINYR